MYEDWSAKSILLSLVLPCIIGAAIIAMPASGVSFPCLLLNILAVGIPILVGLAWNEWAGGCSGFLLASLLSVYNQFRYLVVTGHLAMDVSFTGAIVGSMLAGYVAGALNKGSTALKKLLTVAFIAALVATIFTSATYAIAHPTRHTIDYYLWSFPVDLLAKTATAFGAAIAVNIISRHP